MNLRRLKYFVKIVDVGSLTQAADILHIAQPALSQQLATLEGEVHRQLLVRTKRGVTPTEAGKVLYRHAQLILRQCEQAQADMAAAGQGLSGAVSVGLAPGTAAAALSLPLLRAVRRRHPGVLLYLNETYGTTLSELIMNGRMDLAVLYGGRTAVHGLSFLPLLKEQNGGSLRSPKVTVVNDDAMHWLDQAPGSEPFDLAIVDFPDPSSFAVGKLYTTHLYRRLRARLAEHAAVAVQSTSPLFARRSYWCIMQTLAAAGFRVHPYHAFVPSFGEWGYALALPDLRGSMQTENQAPVFAAEALPEGLRYVGASSLASLFVLSPDMGPLQVATEQGDRSTLASFSPGAATAAALGWSSQIPRVS